MSLFLTCISIRFHQSAQSDLSAPCKNDGSRPGGLDGVHKTLTKIPQPVYFLHRKKIEQFWLVKSTFTDNIPQTGDSLHRRLKKFSFPAVPPIYGKNVKIPMSQIVVIRSHE